MAVAALLLYLFRQPVVLITLALATYATVLARAVADRQTRRARST